MESGGIAIKLDENLSRHLKSDLQEFCYDICSTDEEGLSGKSDEIVAQAACNENRILLTLDLEFANVNKYPPGSHPGIILFRPKFMGPLFVNDFILKFLKNHDVKALSGCVAVVDPTRVRIRKS